MTGEPDQPALVEVVSVPNMVEAEKVAATLRAEGIPAILDPSVLQELRAGRYREHHLAFPVLVPRHYEEQAAGYLSESLCAAEGHDTEESVLAGFDEPNVLPNRSSWRMRGILLFWLLLAFCITVLFLATGGT